MLITKLKNKNTQNFTILVNFVDKRKQCMYVCITVLLIKK